MRSAFPGVAIIAGQNIPSGGYRNNDQGLSRKERGHVMKVPPEILRRLKNYLNIKAIFEDAFPGATEADWNQCAPHIRRALETESDRDRFVEYLQRRGPWSRKGAKAFVDKLWPPRCTTISLLRENRRVPDWKTLYTESSSQESNRYETRSYT